MFGGAITLEQERHAQCRGERFACCSPAPSAGRRLRHYRGLRGQRQRQHRLTAHQHAIAAHDRQQRPVDPGLQRLDGSSGGTVGGINPPTSPLTLSGGTLAFNGNASAAVNETFPRTVTNFGSTVLVNPNGAAGAGQPGAASPATAAC